MISSRYSFIFLHVPKTGGNAVQDALLPFSDDEKSIGSLQDGRDRFQVYGPVTPHKHATLEDYVRRLGSDAFGLKIIVTLRDPVDRALSMFFSPHRVLRLTGDEAPLPFTLPAFEDVLRDMLSVADFLRVDGQVRQADFALRFGALSADLAVFAQAVGLPAPSLERLNVSMGHPSTIEALRSDPDVAAAVRARFAEDYALFFGG